jgi:glutathione synthase
MIEDAISNPHKYVMKPQKEGGGNNLFGDEMKNVLVNNSDIE